MGRPKKLENELFTKISVSLDPELANLLNEYRIKKDRTTTWCVQQALRFWLAKENKGENKGE